MALTPGTRLGPYDIAAQIGTGGMGEVYRARDTRLNRDVALKVLPEAFVLDSDRLARFKREAQVLASLNHPNIAAIYGLEESSGVQALVLELVEGTPLSLRIGAHGLTPNQALKLAVQIAAGLEAAHHAGVVHRDLKPANVLVTVAGNVKLVDFGIAKVIGDAGVFAESRTTEAALTEEGQLLGTVAYMSPEQVRGDPIDARSDLFSFGALLYEMLTGRRPFEAEDKVSTLSGILHHEPAPLTAFGPDPIPRELERIVLRCLRKDRDRRFQTASDLKLALEDLEEDTAEGTTMPSAAAQQARRRGRAWMPWALALVAILAVAVGAVALWTTPRERPMSPLRQLTFDAGVAMMPAGSSLGGRSARNEVSWSSATARADLKPCSRCIR